jgi:hypothetical protein
MRKLTTPFGLSIKNRNNPAFTVAYHGSAQHIIEHYRAEYLVGGVNDTVYLNFASDFLSMYELDMSSLNNAKFLT